MGNFGNFVCFGVYAKVNVVRVAIFLGFPNVFFENIQIDGQSGCVEVVYGHGYVFGFKVKKAPVGVFLEGNVRQGIWHVKRLRGCVVCACV